MRLGTAGYRSFLHGFQQCALRLGRRTIDFVGEHQMRKDRAGLEAQALMPVFGIDNHATDDVGGHEIRRKLNARVLQMKHLRQRSQ